MPVSISVRSDLQRMTALLDGVMTRQIPFAASRALNDVARRAQADVTSALPEIFDRPTPFTTRSIATLAARKDNLVATVLVKDAQAKYLALEETGGTRTPATGKALTLPGPAAKLNQYGNLPKGYQARLQAQADADREKRQARMARVVAEHRRRRLKKPVPNTGVVYFQGHGPHGRGPGGFFRRGPGHTLRRLTGFEATEHYRPRFGFRARVEAVAKREFAAAFARRLAEAASTDP